MIEQCKYADMCVYVYVYNWHETYSSADQGNANAMGSMVQDLAYAIPGVDEAMGFAEVMK